MNASVAAGNGGTYGKSSRRKSLAKIGPPENKDQSIGHTCSICQEFIKDVSIFLN